MYVGNQIKRYEATGVSGDSQVPFSSELKKFFILSRKCQTEFSNTEEYHRSRKFQFNEGDLIKEFVTHTMLLKKCNEGTTMSNTDEEAAVINITDRMIQEGKKYNCQVHFNVIWVYYFTYCDEEINSLPVFKIHKGEGNGAVYVDSFSKVFQTWNCYIDDSGLGESLLCVPRNGEYCFHEGKLNLEFVLTKNMKVECVSNFASCMKHGPQDWVTKVKSWLSNHPEIYATVKKNMNFLKENGDKIFHFAKVLILTYLEHKYPASGNAEQFAIICLQAVKIVFEYNKLQNITTFLIEIAKLLTKNWETYPEAKELLEHFQGPEKNWVTILDLFCCLIKKIRNRVKTPSEKISTHNYQKHSTIKQQTIGDVKDLDTR